MSDSRQLCTFYLAGAHFGVEVERVQEIIRAQPLTRVPLAPREVAGLMNLRGVIVPAIDLRRCLSLPDLPADAEPPTHVVIRTEDGAVSLRVDAIGDVLEVDPSAWEPAPDNLRGGLRGFIRGVYKLGGGLLTVLSTENALAAATARLADRSGRNAPSHGEP